MATGALTDSLRETLTVFETAGDPGEPMTTSEVTDLLDVSRRSTYDRLERLVDHGHLKTKKAGSRGRVWWRPIEQIPDQTSSSGKQQLQLSVSESIAEAASLEEGLQMALEEVCTWTDWEVGLAWTPTEDGGIERLPASYVESSELAAFEEASTEFVFGPGEGIPGQVLESREPVWFPDVSKVSADVYPRTALAAEAGLKAGLGIPVLADGELAVVLEFYMSEPREEDERLVDAVTAVTAGLGSLVARKQTGDALERERDLLEQVMEAAPVGISVFTSDGHVERANSRALDLLRDAGVDTDADTIDMLTAHDGHGEPVPPAERPFERVLETGEPVHDWEAQIDSPDGSKTWLSINAAPILDDDGTVERVVTIAEDITQLKEQAEQLERRYADLESELEDIYGRISDGFYALDDDWRFTYINERAKELIDFKNEGLIGKNIWEVFEWGADSILKEEYQTALETQEPTSFEFYYPDPLDAWYEIHAYPSDSGLSVYFQDITERKERERELEQYETLAETASDVIVTIDDESQIQTINPAVEKVLGYAPDELVGESLTALMPERFTAAHFDGMAQYLKTGARQLDWEYIELPGVRADGTEIPLAVSFSEYEFNGEHYFTGILRDISERKEYEQELERYRTSVETVRDGVYALDPDGRFVMVNDALCEMTGYRREELLGEPIQLLTDEQTTEAAAKQTEQVIAGERETGSIEHTVTTKDGDSILVETRFGPYEYAEDTYARTGVIRDITEHKEREQELARQRMQLVEREQAMRRAYEIIGDPDRSFADQIDELLTVVRETVGTDYATLSHVQGDGYIFEAIDAPTDADLEAGDAVPLEVTNCKQVVSSRQTLVLNDVERDAPELADRAGNAEWGISSYLGAPVMTGDEVYGSFCFYSMEPRTEEFSDWEVAFVELLSNWVSNELERQQYTDQLAALNELNDVSRGIVDAVIDKSTREEIEAVVCEHLAETDSYQFAWIGDVDAATQTVTVRAEAGVDGYLEDTEISIDPDDEHGQGPTGRALRTGEIQTTQDIQNDPEFEPWRETARKYDFRSSAAIPIVHEGTIYGVLNVYAARPYAFEGQERVVIGQLGEVVGHAIAAVERKRALMSDEVVELEFQIQNVFETFGVDADTTGTISLDETVPLTDDEYLVYGHATADAVETVSALVEAVPAWTEVTFKNDDGDTEFELKLSEPPVLSTLASLGGSVEEATIEDGNYQMTLHLSPSADVRQVIDAVLEAYPSAEMLSRRQRSRTDETSEGIDQVLGETLTDRQRGALQAAYHAGFFEWPRDTSGQDVAESLGVSPPTFHQHLRKAEKKVFDSFLSSFI